MLVSVAIGVILTYPVIFLPDFPGSGISGLPHHVWTGSSSVESRPEKQPDLEMRQVWMYGSYMQALNKSTLKEAFKLQQAILPHPPSSIDNFADLSSDPGWGHHSPLIFWNDSLPVLQADDNVLDTINNFAQSTSLLNFTLRSMSVFAGKSLSNCRLNAADALILTLFNRQDDTVGGTWQTTLNAMAASPPTGWTVGNREGTITTSRVYEYRSQPLSFRQNSALAIAYGFMLFYVVVSLRRLKAFRSRFGLVVTALTQMTTSILASFTICGLLKINLAQIPQEAYPFVVLTIGLENIFRLINAVLAYPPEMPPQQRIANGLGDIGHSSLVSAAQNLLILWLLSLVVSPGVSAFCAFAAVALLFDYFFLITFFVAVLNVDMRRLELQDSITRSGPAKPRRRTKPASRPSWIDALIRGRVPFSTRMAGSAVTITFVMALNWHFSDHSIASLRQKSWSVLSQIQKDPSTEPDSATPSFMNQTRRSSSWLRMQDYDNAVHLMSIVKPGAQSFTARVYDPLVLILTDADRNGMTLYEKTWLLALRDLASHHFYPFALAVVFVVAFVTVLMNFLLWDGRAEEAEKEKINQSNGGPLCIETVETGHRLDIVKIVSTASEHILTAGYDRTLWALIKDRLSRTYTRADFSHDDHSLTKATDLSIDWPITEVVRDAQSDSFALLCASGKLLCGGVKSGHITQCLDDGTEIERQDVALLAYLPLTQTQVEDKQLILLTSRGMLYHYWISSGQTSRHDMSMGGVSVLSACILLSSSSQPTVIGILSSGGMFTYTNVPSDQSWQLDLTLPDHKPFNLTGNEANEKVAKGGSIWPCLELDVVLVSLAEKIHVLDPASLGLLSTFRTPGLTSDSARLLHSRRETCPECGSVAVSSIGFAYTEISTDACIIVLASAETDAALPPICLSASSSRCRSLSSEEFRTHRLPGAGAWESTSALAIAGIRRSPATTSLTTTSNTEENTGLLRRRRPRSPSTLSRTSDDADEWEAYIFTLSGTLHTAPIPQPSDSENYLYASEPGPACRLGSNGVCVALGNVVYIIRVGRDGGKRTELNLQRSGSSASKKGIVGRRKGRKSQ